MTAFSHQQPDRVPVDYSANPSIDKRLKEYFGLAPDDESGLRERIGQDFCWIPVPYVGPRLHAELPGRRVSPEWGIRTTWVEHETGGYWEHCDFPLKDADEETVAQWPMPSADDYDYAEVKAFCERNRFYALHMGDPGLGDIINSTGFLFGTERTLMGLAIGDPGLLRFIDRRLDVQVERLYRTLEAGEGMIDFVYMGEDLGSQHAPLISPELYRRVIKPRHRRVVEAAKAYGLPVMIHSCGSSSWAFDDFIDLGISVVDTLQPEAADMQPYYLKSTYGDRLCFHGCISTGGAVAFGTVDDVVTEVRTTLDIMMPGGGYCLSPTHMLQDNSPVENVVALYETALTYGRYS